MGSMGLPPRRVVPGGARLQSRVRLLAAWAALVVVVSAVHENPAEEGLLEDGVTGVPLRH